MGKNKNTSRKFRKLQKQQEALEEEKKISGSGGKGWGSSFVSGLGKVAGAVKTTVGAAKSAAVAVNGAAQTAAGAVRTAAGAVNKAGQYTGVNWTLGKVKMGAQAAASSLAEKHRRRGSGAGRSVDDLLKDLWNGNSTDVTNDTYRTIMVNYVLIPIVTYRARALVAMYILKRNIDTVSFDNNDYATFCERFNLTSYFNENESKKFSIFVSNIDAIKGLKDDPSGNKLIEYQTQFMNLFSDLDQDNEDHRTIANKCIARILTFFDIMLEGATSLQKNFDQQRVESTILDPKMDPFNNEVIKFNSTIIPGLHAELYLVVTRFQRDLGAFVLKGLFQDMDQAQSIISRMAKAMDWNEYYQEKESSQIVDTDSKHDDNNLFGQVFLHRTNIDDIITRIRSGELSAVSFVFQGDKDKVEFKDEVNRLNKYLRKIWTLIIRDPNSIRKLEEVVKEMQTFKDQANAFLKKQMSVFRRQFREEQLKDFDSSLVKQLVANTFASVVLDAYSKKVFFELVRKRQNTFNPVISDNPWDWIDLVEPNNAAKTKALIEQVLLEGQASDDKIKSLNSHNESMLTEAFKNLETNVREYVIEDNFREYVPLVVTKNCSVKDDRVRFTSINIRNQIAELSKLHTYILDEMQKSLETIVLPCVLKVLAVTNTSFGEKVEQFYDEKLRQGEPDAINLITALGWSSEQINQVVNLVLSKQLLQEKVMTDHLDPEGIKAFDEMTTKWYQAFTKNQLFKDDRIFKMLQIACNENDQQALEKKLNIIEQDLNSKAEACVEQKLLELNSVYVKEDAESVWLLENITKQSQTIDQEYRNMIRGDFLKGEPPTFKNRKTQDILDMFTSRQNPRLVSVSSEQYKKGGDVANMIAQACRGVPQDVVEEKNFFKTFKDKKSMALQQQKEFSIWLDAVDLYMTQLYRLKVELTRLHLNQRFVSEHIQRLKVATSGDSVGKYVEPELDQTFFPNMSNYILSYISDTNSVQRQTETINQELQKVESSNRNLLARASQADSAFAEKSAKVLVRNALDSLAFSGKDEYEAKANKELQDQDSIETTPYEDWIKSNAQTFAGLTTTESSMTKAIDQEITTLNKKVEEHHSEDQYELAKILLQVLKDVNYPLEWKYRLYFNFLLHWKSWYDEFKSEPYQKFYSFGVLKHVEVFPIQLFKAIVTDAPGQEGYRTEGTPITRLPKTVKAFGQIQLNSLVNYRDFFKAALNYIDSFFTANAPKHKLMSANEQVQLRDKAHAALKNVADRIKQASLDNQQDTGLLPPLGVESVRSIMALDMFITEKGGDPISSDYSSLINWREKDLKSIRVGMETIGTVLRRSDVPPEQIPNLIRLIFVETPVKEVSGNANMLLFRVLVRKFLMMSFLQITTRQEMQNVIDKNIIIVLSAIYFKKTVIDPKDLQPFFNKDVPNIETYAANLADIFNRFRTFILDMIKKMHMDYFKVGSIGKKIGQDVQRHLQEWKQNVLNSIEDQDSLQPVDFFQLNFKAVKSAKIPKPKPLDPIDSKGASEPELKNPETPPGINSDLDMPISRDSRIRKGRTAVSKPLSTKDLTEDSKSDSDIDDDDDDNLTMERKTPSFTPVKSAKKPLKLVPIDSKDASESESKIPKTPPGINWDLDTPISITPRIRRARTAVSKPLSTKDLMKASKSDSEDDDDSSESVYHPVDYAAIPGSMAGAWAHRTISLSEASDAKIDSIEDEVGTTVRPSAPSWSDDRDDDDDARPIKYDTEDFDEKDAIDLFKPPEEEKLHFDHDGFGGGKGDRMAKNRTGPIIRNLNPVNCNDLRYPYSLNRGNPQYIVLPRYPLTAMDHKNQSWSYINSAFNEMVGSENAIGNSSGKQIKRRFFQKSMVRGKVQMTVKNKVFSRRIKGSEYRGMSGTWSEWTYHTDFYDYNMWKLVSDTPPDGSNSFMNHLNGLVRRFCTDQSSRDQLVWFLLNWCFYHEDFASKHIGQFHDMEQGIGDPQKHVGPLLVWSLVETLYDILDLPNLAFHPFITGFIDNQEEWEENTVEDPENPGKKMLKVPEGNDDPLAVLLRTHPNNYLIRLSPSHPGHIEFVRYRVKNLEKDRHARKLLSFVEVKRVNLLQMNLQMNSLQVKNRGNMVCSYFSVLYAMRNLEEMTLLDGGGGGGSARFTPQTISMYVLLMAYLFVAYKGSEEFAMVMTSYNSSVNYLRNYVCQDPRVTQTIGFVNYGALITEFKDNQAGKELFLRKMVVSDVKRIMPELLDNAEQFYNGEQACGSLFPGFDRFGDPGCRIDDRWMRDVRDVGVEQLNPLLTRLVNIAYIEFLNPSLWFCADKNFQDIRQFFTGLYKWATDKMDNTLPRATQKKLIEYVQAQTREKTANHINALHIIRWLGVDYWKAKLIANESKDPLPEGYQVAEAVLKFMLRSTFAYPFLTDQQAENMLELFGDMGKRQGVVMRLSTSMPMQINIRTHLPNKNYNPETAYVSKYVEKVISFDTWGTWFGNTAPLTSTGKPQSVNILWAFMKYIFKDMGHMVIIRSIPIIKLYLRACNRDGFFQDEEFWKLGLNDNDKHDALQQALTKVKRVAKRREQSLFKDIESATIEINSQAEMETSGQAACPVGSYPKVNLLGKYECTSEENWMFQQKLLVLPELEQKAAKLSQQGTDTKYIEALIHGWQQLNTVSTPWAKNWYMHWCNTGYRGDRNMTWLLNWVGADCLYYLQGKDINRVIEGRPVSSEDSKFGWILNVFQLMEDPSFPLFINPEEAVALAKTYPGFVVLNFSATQPGSLTVRYVSTIRITEMVEDEIYLPDMESFLGREAYREIPFPLLVRLMLYSQYGAHLLTVPEAWQRDAKACQRQAPNQPDLKVLIQEYVDNIDFKDDVPFEIANRLLTLALSDSGIEKPDEWIQPWRENPAFKDQLRWVDRSSVLGSVQAAGSWMADWWRRAKQVGESIRRGANHAWQKYIINWTQQPSHFWFGSGRQNKTAFTMLIKAALSGKGSPESQIAISSVNFATMVSQAVYDPQPTKVRTLITQATKAEKNAEAMETVGFGGRSPNKKGLADSVGSFFKKIFNRGSQDEEKAGQDDTRILQLADTGNDTLAYQMIMQKMNRKLPLGPKEGEIAMRLGLISAPPDVIPGAYVPSTGPFLPPGTTDSLSRITNTKFKHLDEQTGASSDNYFKQLTANNFDTLGCDDQSSHPYAAFDVVDGKVVARCGKKGWMSQVPYNTSDFSRLDPTTQKIFERLQKIAKHWCPTSEHVVRLWRWIGIGCLSSDTLNYMQQLAMEKLDDDTASGNSIAVLKQASLSNQLKMIQSFRDDVEQKKSAPEQDAQAMQADCDARINFLSQMVDSGILFPYVEDETVAMKLAQFELDRVVVMLSWSRSGRVVMYKISSETGVHDSEEVQASVFVNNMQRVPTLVRLHIFNQFGGAIAATNERFYNELAHSTNRPQCAVTLAHMRFFSFRAVLPNNLAAELTALYSQYERGMLGPEGKKRVQKIKNMSLLIQAENLTRNQADIFENIMKLEEDRRPPAVISEMARRLYKAKASIKVIEDAKRAENMTLCQSPEFVPYMRQKYHDLHPEVSIDRIKQMTREELCRALVHVDQIEQMNFPLLVWQIKDVPDALKNQMTQLLDLWNERKAKEVEAFLMKHYGVRRDAMLEYNKAYRDNPGRLQEQARVNLEMSLNKQKLEKQQVKSTILFRQYLLNARDCGSIPETDCDFDGNSDSSLCQLAAGSCQNRKTLSIEDLFGKLFDVFCSPSVTMLPNDFEFLLETYNTLMNFHALAKLKRPESGGRMDLHCANTQAMYRTLRKSSSSTSWAGNSVKDFVRNSNVIPIINKYFEGNLSQKVKNKPLKVIWGEFAATRPSMDQMVAFTYVVLLYIVSVNGIMKL